MLNLLDFFSGAKILFLKKPELYFTRVCRYYATKIFQKLFFLFEIPEYRGNCLYSSYSSRLSEGRVELTSQLRGVTTSSLSIG
jgi:hypothetical protein